MDQSILVVTQSGIVSDSRVLRELSSLEQLGRPIFLLCLDSAERVRLAPKVGEVEVLQLPPSGPTRPQLAAIFVILIAVATTALVAFPEVSLAVQVAAIFVIVAVLSLLYFIMVRPTTTAHPKYFGLQDILFGRNTLRIAMLQVQPVVLHLHDVMPLGLLSKTTLGLIPKPFIIWDAHELYHEQYGSNPLKSLVKKVLIKRKLRLINEVVTVSDGVAQRYQLDFDDFPPVTVVENASSALPVGDKGDILQHRLEISRESQILLFQGGLVAGRGIPFLLQLILQLPESWKLVFMGSGPYEGIVQQSVHQSPGRVFFHPAVSPNELSRYTSCATLGAIPYERVCLNHEHALPNKLWEYAVAGVPVLARNLSDLSRKVLHHRIGLVFSDVESVSEVANRIREIGPSEWNAFSTRALTFATNDNWEKYERELLGVYKKLLQH